MLSSSLNQQPSKRLSQPSDLTALPRVVPSVDQSNAKVTGIEQFWLSDESAEYERFSREVIPANWKGIMPANALTVAHVISKGLSPRFIDLGSFRGESTMRLLGFVKEFSGLTDNRRFGDLARVIGLDCIGQHIDAASSRFEGVPQLFFQHLPQKAQIPLPKASGITMFFVDQVIADNSTLELTFRKAFTALKKGGILTILRLAEESFDPELNFAFYRHNKHLRGGLQGFGEAFTNELVLPVRDQETGVIKRDEEGNMLTQSLQFVDHFRRRNFIARMLTEAGFSQVGQIPLDRSISDGSQGVVSDYYNAAVAKVNTEIPELNSGIYSDDSVPLHEIIFAVKE